MPLSNHQLEAILQKLHNYSSSAAEFIISLLQDDLTNNTPVEEIAARMGEIFGAMKSNAIVRPQLLHWANEEIKNTYAAEILTLVQKTTGFHFVARKATTTKLEELNIDEMASRMHELAPTLWELLGVLLQADPDIHRKRIQARERRKRAKEAEPRQRTEVPDKDGDTIMDNPTEGPEDSGDLPAGDDMIFWEDVDDAEDVFNSDVFHQLCAEDASPFPTQSTERYENDSDEEKEDPEEREEALITIKKIICMSIMMHSSNQRCNALQSLLGIFLHSCNAPQTVVELMAHLGVSISTTAINQAIANLSKEAFRELRNLGGTLLTAYAYDNVDMDLKHTIPTLENPGATLIHLTSGTLIPLEHNVTEEDLNCSKELWEKSRLNPNRSQATDADVNDEDFARIHQEKKHTSGLLRRERFNAWVFRRDLVNYGPKEFRLHRKSLGLPEAVDKIPVVKSRQVHAHMMDTACATPAENAQVLEDMTTKQAGIGDPVEDPSLVDIKNLVVLLYGDLGVGQHVQSLLASRSAEKTPWRRLQFVIYCLGLFHVKMACADAIWRMFISDKKSRNESDAYSLMKLISILRPKETRKIETKPGFRRMHEVIQHVGDVTRLDCWRLVAKDKGFTSLEEFAASNPSWDMIQKYSEEMCQTYVATKSFSSARREDPKTRDQVNENMLLRQRYFLLYEEMSFMMNEGDIGGVEACFVPWIWLFQSTGKHRYATYIRKYLRDVHFIYPKGLRRAIRMNILVNPTGKRGRFRGVDWWVEHNNLYIKRIYGGKFSNHTKFNILKESPLIGVFKNTRIQVEHMFRMTNKTVRHSAPNMEKTFAKLATYLATSKTHEYIAGRPTKFSIRDYLVEGQHLSTTQKAMKVRGEDYGSDWEDMSDDELIGNKLPDDEEEVEELGDLDV